MKVIVFLVVVIALVSPCWGKGNCTENCGDGTFCCEDLCCYNHTESCCPDPQHGSVCCVAETTYCCPPLGAYDSRCCPRWYVCCNGGKYGCCDPTTGKAMGDDGNDANDGDDGDDGDDVGDGGDGDDGNFAYSLFVLENNFAAIKIDLTSGKQTQVDVTGYDDWSEITRVFTYDAVNNLFYLLQTDFIDNPQASFHNITLYTVDPVAGTTVAKTVQGCQEEGDVDVPGFVFNYQTGLIVMSTQYFQNNMTGYKFYTLDPRTAVATLQSSYLNETDTFAGWFHDVSPDGNAVYRLGFQDVFNQQVSGVGITDISASIATTQWVSDVPLPPALQFYVSFSLYGDNILSLAPDASGNLHLVQWQIGGTASVLAKLSNAHNTPLFGPIIEFVNSNQTQYAALIVQDAVLSDFDKWAVVLVDLPSGNAKEYTLTPSLYAELVSASALGIPN